MTLLIGIAGGTGSGKTTISRNIKASFSKDERVSILEIDSYYKDFGNISEENRRVINFDHPSSIDFKLLKQHVRALLKGYPIEKPIYDFVHHTRSSHTEAINPSDIFIIEGILAFHDEEFRNLLDVKIFVDTDADIRILRRLRRDIEQRGRSFEDIRQQYYATVRPMHNKYVAPTKQWADIVIPEGGNNEVAINLVTALIKSKLHQSEQVYNTPSMDKQKIMNTELSLR